MVSLHLGCGRTILPGWINIDSFAGPGVDLVLDLDKCGVGVLPYHQGEVEEIFASHLFEHLRNPLPLMQELYRAAKVDAKAVFRVPYGSSDDAYEDPTHVRQCFLQTFSYFSQPFYWRADYGYRGDWKTEQITLLIPKQLGEQHSEAAVMHMVHHERNIVTEMVVELVAVKPMRQPLRELRDQPPVTLVYI